MSYRWSILWSLLSITVSAAAVFGQDGSTATDSEWRYVLLDVKWDAVEQLQECVRAYRQQGAIGDYELEFRAQGPRYQVSVVADVADVARLARLRGVVPHGIARAQREEISPPWDSDEDVDQPPENPGSGCVYSP